MLFVLWRQRTALVGTICSFHLVPGSCLFRTVTIVSELVLLSAIVVGPLSCNQSGPGQVPAIRHSFTSCPAPDMRQRLGPTEFFVPVWCEGRDSDQTIWNFPPRYTLNLRWCLYASGFHCNTDLGSVAVNTH